MSLCGKVAIVTGGARGIGRSYSTALLNNGVKVCICDVLEDAAKEFIESLSETLKRNVIFHKCDVTVYEDLKDAFDKTVETFGIIDIVVNNAGVGENNWKRGIEVNLIAVIQCIKLAFEYLGIDMGGKGGYVVNTASIAGLEGVPLSPVYSATKRAVVGLTRSYGADYHLRKSGIKVNAICPGAVDTHLFRDFLNRNFDKEEATQFLDMYPLNPVENLGRALIKILEDGKNGSLLRIDENGVNYI